MQLVEPNAVKPELATSVTVYVPGERLVKLPVRVTVVPLAPPLRVIELPPGVSEKVKLPLPPSTCFVTTIAPFAAFVKAGRHGVAPAPVTTAIHVVAPTGTKSGFVPSVTVYVPCGRPANVAVPLPATVVPVVVIVAVALTPVPVSVKVNTPLPPVVFLVTTTEPFAAFANAGRHGVEPAPVTTAVHVVTAATKSGLAASVTVYVPCARPENVAVPLPATVLPVVEIVADMVTPGPVSVKVKVPLPPVVFLVTTTEPRALLRNEGVQGVEPAPVTTAVHVVNPTGTKSALAASVTVYVPGARPLNVAVPLPVRVVPVVEIVADMVTPGPVSVKVKVPLPPVVFLVTTTEPRALLRNEGVQGVEPAPVTTAVHVVNPTGTKSALAASVTVYVPGARPLNVAVPLPVRVVPVVEIVADMVTPPGPVSVKPKVPLPPVVFLVTTTEPPTA